MNLIDNLDMFKPEDEIEAIHLDVDDSFLSNSDVNVTGYLNGYTIEDDPDRALIIDIDHYGINLQVFLNTSTMDWQSSVCGCRSLSPQQMEKFFKTELFRKIVNDFDEKWNGHDNKILKNLVGGLHHKKLCVSPYGSEYVQEDSQFQKRNIDIEKSREKNVAGQQIRTNSGRLIVTFSDFGVTKKEEAKFFCWPKLGKEFKYSQWNIAEKVYDESKSNPIFLRMSFWHNEYEYGLNLGLRDEIDENRGFFGYNLTLQPPVQWMTPVETDQMILLTVVQKFLHICKRRIEYYIDLDTDYIYKQINNPAKITREQIDSTKSVIRQNLDIVRNPRADTYIYD